MSMRLGCGAGAVGGEAEQQPERVAVAGDGVGAGPALPDESFGEERLQQRREGAHESAPAMRPARSGSRAAASCINSGTAVKYQNVDAGET